MKKEIINIGLLMMGFILGILFHRRWIKDNDHDM
jgi:uncharacterized membrane protein YqaE (UPF0057 family)